MGFFLYLEWWGLTSQRARQCWAAFLLLQRRESALVARNRTHFFCLKFIALFSAQVLVSRRGCHASSQRSAIAGQVLGGRWPCFQSLVGGGWAESQQGASQEEKCQLKPLCGLANPCQWAISPGLNAGRGVRSKMVIRTAAMREAWRGP